MSQKPPLSSAYLLIGNDVPKLRLAVARSRKRFVTEAGHDLNIVAFDAEVDSVEKVLDAASTPGFTFGTRLLLVLNVHKWTAKSRQALAGYFHDPMPDTCLVVEAESFNKAKDPLRKATDPLRKAVAAAGEVRTYDLPKNNEMVGWVQKLAKDKRLAMSQGVAHHFLERCGMDPKHSERLEREIEKLATYCGGNEVSVDDIDAVTTADDEANIFRLMDAVGDRQSSRAFALLEMVYIAGEDPNKVLYMLLRHIGQLEATRRMGTADPAKVAKQVGVPFRNAKDLLEQSAHYDSSRIGSAYMALASAETGMRGREPAKLESESGVNHTDRLVLELALARLIA